jgi:hypothetical protein
MNGPGRVRLASKKMTIRTVEEHEFVGFLKF